MAIQVTCPSCESNIQVDDKLAGKDVLCPTCKERVTVPSLAAGRPEARLPAAPEDSYEEDERSRRRERRDADLPRWRDAEDYALPPHRDPSRWSATSTGLALVFWAVLLIAAFSVIARLITLMVGGNPQLFMGGAGGNPNNAVALGLGFMALGCGIIVLLIIGFVGMCMCCTVPSESGAKGRAITAVMLVVAAVIGLIIFFIVAFFAGIRMAAQAAGGGPLGMPFSSRGIVMLAIVATLMGILIVTIWLMFHKAIANYLQNARLSRWTVIFTILYVLETGGSFALQLFANPAFQGNFGVLPDPTLLIVATVWNIIWGVGLVTFYLFINRETRRSIAHDLSAADDAE